MRCDGEFIIYVLDAQATQPKESNKWFRASLDHFGSPAGFTASDPCWQKTGIMGTFNREEGVRAAEVMAREHVEYNWRLTRLEISRHSAAVATFAAMKPGANPPDGYPTTAEMRRRYTAIHGEGV